MKQIVTLLKKCHANNFAAAKISFFLLMLVSLQNAYSQTGYLYIHTKALSKDLNQTFTFYETKINSSGTVLVYYARSASAPTAGDIAVDNNGMIYSIGLDTQSMDAVYRYNGTSWTEEPETGLFFNIRRCRTNVGD
jgi:hypothetical protein